MMALPHTCRLLVDEACTEVMIGKRFAHVTLGYMDGSPDAAIAFFDSPLPAQMSGRITGVTCVGPMDNVPAYEVELDKATNEVAEKFWDEHGALEPWMVEAGMSKGRFDDAPEDINSYVQKHHITIGKDQADMKANVGKTVHFTKIDIKPLGPHDPIFSIAI